MSTQEEGGERSMKNQSSSGQRRGGRWDPSTHQFLEGGGAGQRVEEREGLVGDAPQLGALHREARDLREGLLQREEAETLMYIT